MTGVHSAAAARTPKNRRKKAVSSPRESRRAAKMEPIRRVFVNMSDRFLKRNACVTRQFNEKLSEKAIGAELSTEKS
jgi:hypothetical protein